MACMRTHAQIVGALDAVSLAEKRGVSVHTVKSWVQRDSIPAEHWAGFVEDGHSSFEELAAGVKSRKAA